MLKNFFAKKTPGQTSSGLNASRSGRDAGGAGAACFEVRETKLCAELGVSKDVLRERRQYFLAQGVHWDYVDKRVLLSRIGAQILRGTMDAVVPPSGGGTNKNGAAADSGATAARPVKALLNEKNPPPVVFKGELVVWGVPARNPKLIVAYIPGSDPENPLNLVTVHVRENTHFLRGMKLKAAQVGETHFDLVGPCPRWRGRW